MNFHIILFFMWLIVGIVTLINKPTRWNYALCWIPLLANILERAFRG